MAFPPTEKPTALIDVSNYSAETEVPWFRSRVVCAKCGGRGNKIDVRPNWKEQPSGASLTGKVWRAGRGLALVPPQQLQLIGDKFPRGVQHTGFFVLWRAAVGLRFQKVQDFLHGEKLVHSLNHVCSPGRASLRSVTDNADLHM
jgi:hypothetical protein